MQRDEVHAQRIAVAVRDLHLTLDERGFVEWLSGFDPDTVTRFVGVVEAARRAGPQRIRQR